MQHYTPKKQTLKRYSINFQFYSLESIDTNKILFWSLPRMFVKKTFIELWFHKLVYFEYPKFFSTFLTYHRLLLNYWRILFTICLLFEYLMRKRILPFTKLSLANRLGEMRCWIFRVDFLFHLTEEVLKIFELNIILKFFIGRVNLKKNR